MFCAYIADKPIFCIGQSDGHIGVFLVVRIAIIIRFHSQIFNPKIGNLGALINLVNIGSGIFLVKRHKHREVQCDSCSVDGFDGTLGRHIDRSLFPRVIRSGGCFR